MNKCPKCGEPREGSRCKPCRAEAKRNLRAAKKDPALHDYTSKPVPGGFEILGASQYDPVRKIWIKTKASKEHRHAQLLEAIETIGEKLPREPVIAPPASTAADLMCVYPMGDPHLGMYAWSEEAGENFDLKIAERELVGAVDHLVHLAPPAETAVVINLGDFFHSDNRLSTTTAGTPVDVDGRWSRVLGVGVRVVCRIIDRALEKHLRVIARMEIGNHDEHTSIMLAICLQHHYRDNPRVHIDTSPAHFWYHEWGKCLIMSTHGNNAKMKDLAAIMSVDMPEAWGRTLYRHAYTGHIHHDSRIELMGLTAESFRTMAPKDAWHAKQGYRSGRDMRLDVWHKEHGMINRHIVGIQQVRAGL